MNLYEIDHEIMDLIDEETGEIINEELFDTLSMERDAKVENIALWIKNLSAEAEALKAEKMKFADRQRVTENKVSNLKNYLSTYLEGTSFNSTRVKVSFRKTEALQIIDIQQIPEEFLKVTVDVNKTELKKAIKDGIQCAGAEIVNNYNIQVK